MLAGLPDANGDTTKSSTTTATTTIKKDKHPDTHTMASILSCQADKVDKAGWLRRFCGKVLFREIWKNRFVILKDQQLMVCEKEGRAGADEVLDLSHFGSCDDVKKHKKKNRSKKNHSKFTLQRCCSANNTVVSVLFLAVSPEDKESWINVINVAITRAKNKILDQVTTDETQLCHLTRDRARIGHGRRLPSRGHLLAVASLSDGTMTLDLIHEEDVPTSCKPESGDLESPLASSHDGSIPHGTFFVGTAQASGKSQSLPREAPAKQPTGPTCTFGPGNESRTSQKNRCASMDEISSHSDKNRATPLRSDASASVSRLHRLISLKVAQTEQLLAATRDAHEFDRPKGKDGKRIESVEEMRMEASNLLKEALAALEQARRVLQEVKELRELHGQLDQFQKKPAPAQFPKLKPQNGQANSGIE
ncbi:pleckstrin homology domain-containing family O member 1b isoform X2 [Hippocampus zosterae]|uniref:pleckstrin homology domain-containing family O member 1b isoform X2 n=1 Tax=Hippocampus zosterae TaxID=109293 RepID=UPI00223DF4B8|nr:pleckstrin homology domain-containing family O member 1b isoform X2 [Hippocampus zosterae]